MAKLPVEVQAAMADLAANPPGPPLPDLPPLATAPQVAAWLQCTVDSLAQDRYRGRGLPFIKVGGRVRYRREDVLNYLSTNTFGGDAA